MLVRRFISRWLLLAVFWAVSCAEPVPTQPETNIDSPSSTGTGSLFESAGDAKVRRDRQRAKAVEASIEMLPGVVRSRVQLTLPLRSPFDTSRPDKGSAAVVVVRNNPTSPELSELRALVLAAVPELSSETVHVFLSSQTPTPCPSTVAVGPIEVVATSAVTARLVLGVLLGLCLLSSAGLIGAGLKIRRLRKSSR